MHWLERCGEEKPRALSSRGTRWRGAFWNACRSAWLMLWRSLHPLALGAHVLGTIARRELHHPHQRFQQCGVGRE